MKSVALILAVFCQLLTAPATTLYQETFSGVYMPGSFKRGPGGTFFNSWTNTASLQTLDTNQHARFDIFISRTSTNPGDRWWGGSHQFLGEFLALPSVWQLTFRIWLPTSEPFKVALEVGQPTRGRRPDFRPREYSCWITPQGGGWQSVTIRNSDVIGANLPYEYIGLSGTSLKIMMASHTTNGVPLTISQMGLHTFLLDDVRFTFPDAPYIWLQAGSTTLFSLFSAGVVQTSSDLIHWTTPVIQPGMHSLITRTSNHLFFRAVAP